jgi:hypothetical protein
MFDPMKIEIVKLLVPVVVASLAGCSDGRPEIAEAKLQFEKNYPDIQIVTVRISDDEVNARSFTFRYRKHGFVDEKEIGIQFRENPQTRKWAPIPAPPKVLL